MLERFIASFIQCIIDIYIWHHRLLMLFCSTISALLRRRLDRVPRRCSTHSGQINVEEENPHCFHWTDWIIQSFIEEDQCLQQMTQRFLFRRDSDLSMNSHSEIDLLESWSPHRCQLLFWWLSSHHELLDRNAHVSVSRRKRRKCGGLATLSCKHMPTIISLPCGDSWVPINAGSEIEIQFKCVGF